MPTFQELKQSAAVKQARIDVLTHLVEYLDENFRPVAGEKARRMLLNDEKVPLPPEAFEGVVNEVLLDEIGVLREELHVIQNSQMSGAVTTPATSATQVPPPQEAATEQTPEQPSSASRKKKG